ncbi:MAG TPA: hypothetical protein VF126_09915 [Acidobacteriaceae bacterium]
MRHAKVSLLSLLFACFLGLIAGCGSTGTDSGGGSFTIGADSAVTIAQGESRTFTVTPTGSSDFKGSIQVSVSGMPSGVTLSPTTVSVTAGIKTTFTLSAAADATVGTANLAVEGVSGALNARTAVKLTVTASAPPPSVGDFTLTAAPPTLTLTPGASAQVTLASTAKSGFSGTIAVAVSGLPTGVTISPSTITVTPNNPLSVTLTAANDAPAAATPVQVRFTGTSGSLSHMASVQVSVSATADFSMTMAPSSIAVAQGTQSNTLQLGVTGNNGFAGQVTYTVSGLPQGVTLTPATGTLEDGWVEPMVFNAAANAAIGNATVTITGVSGVRRHTVTVALTVTAPAPPDSVALALAPDSATITIGSIATVSVTATATQGYTGTVNVTAAGLPAGVTMLPATADLAPGVSQTFMLAASANAQPGSATVTFTGKVNSVTGSADLALTVANPASSGVDVPTWHYDSARTGLNSMETVLTPAEVATTAFQKSGVWPTDGAVDAQPLYISGLTIGSQVHNVLYTATENGTVYALDAMNGTQLWKTSALGANETAADNQGCSELGPQVGITATPVIDRYYGPDGAIFLVAKTKDSNGIYHQRLHALDLTTGAELSGSPVDITVMFGTASFDPGVFVEQAALLVSNGIVYLSWGAPCHQTTFDYSGWVMAYNESTLEQLSVLDVTPGGSGGGIWMSGAGPAADANASVFLITSEGTFDTTLDANGNPQNSNYGNGYLKIQAPGGVMTVFDYFEPLNGVPGATHYADQGSGGVMLVPDTATGSALAIGAGKDANIYVMFSEGNVLGEYNGTTDRNYQTLTAGLPNGATSSPAYFNGEFYYGGSGDALKAFGLNVAGSTVTSQSASVLGAAGATPVISADGTSTAVLWALDTTATGGAVLHAYDATNLATQLYSSATNASRDAVGSTNEHAVPVVANGYVYIGTQAGVAVYGPVAGTCSAVTRVPSPFAVSRGPRALCQGWGN